ncbi:MAG: hypothetical protein ACOYWZ_09000 [Bacillota bacterium]
MDDSRVAPGAVAAAGPGAFFAGPFGIFFIIILIIILIPFFGFGGFAHE